MIRNQIPEISLSKSNLEDLSKDLDRMIEEAEELHGTWEQLHDTYLRQYMCIPDVEMKTYPWLKASNLCLPLARVIQDAVMSQFHDAMFANDPPLKVISTKGVNMSDAEPLSIFYGDYVWKQLIPIQSLGNSWNFQLCLDGTSCVLPRWSRVQQLLRKRDISFTQTTRTIKGPPLLGLPTETKIPTGLESNIIERVTVEREERPYVDIVDMGKLYFAPDTGLAVLPTDSLQWPNCRWYFVRADLTLDDLYERKRRGYRGIDKDLISKLSSREQTFREDTLDQDEDQSPSVTQRTVRLYEFYMRRTLPTYVSYTDSDGKQRSRKQKFDDPEGFAEEIIVRYWPDTHTVAQVVPLQRVCPNNRRPHILNWFNPIPGRIYGQGIQAKMKMLNDWSNTSANQMVDYGHVQNMPWFFYVPHLTGQLPDVGGLRPGQGVPVQDPRGVQFPRFAGDQSFWLNMLQYTQGWAERDGTVPDQLVGRLPEKSANKTYRGMALVQQNMNIAFARLAALIVLPYIELFRSVHQLYSRHQTSDIIFKVSGKNVKIPMESFTQELDFQFLINPNRQAEQQTTQALYQLMVQIPYIQQNPYAIRALARQVYNATGSAMGYRNFDEFWPESMTPGIVKMQQQQIMQGQGIPPQPGMPGMPPQPGMPPSPPQPGMPPAPTQPDLPLTKVEESESENDVTLQ